jgi:hypothetical protein
MEDTSKHPFAWGEQFPHLTLNQRTFLAAFSEVGTIVRAAESSGIARANHYTWLSDPAVWLCQCACDKTAEVIGTNLTSKEPTQSCGCLKAQVAARKRKLPQEQAETRRILMSNGWTRTNFDLTNARTKPTQGFRAEPSLSLLPEPDHMLVRGPVRFRARGIKAESVGCLRLSLCSTPLALILLMLGCGE